MVYGGLDEGSQVAEGLIAAQEGRSRPRSRCRDPVIFHHVVHCDPNEVLMRRRILPLFVLFAVLGVPTSTTEACHVAARLHFENAPPEERMKRAHELAAPWLNLKMEMDMTPIPYRLKAAVDCKNGTADGFPCDNVDLLAHMPLSSIGGGNGNDSWGWTDSSTGREYALVGRTSGTSFVDITDPQNPVYLGNLPTRGGTSSWRDIKVYDDHAFVVADFVTGHGMQVFDLKQLRSVDSPPVTFEETAHYDGFSRAHNVVMNEETGFAFAVGSEVCSGGLHIIDVQTPASPVFAGCYDDDAYTHDAQCVVYRGPDADHFGKEVCFASNEDTLTIVDVTDKKNPTQISRNGYAGWGYTHQGWLSDDHALFFLDDEGDEGSFGHNTRTYVWDLRDLDSPTMEQVYESAFPSTDHNQYVKGNYIYQANYSIGLRILERNPETTAIREVAFFDTFPESNSSSGGAWSVFPFFESGTVIISDINRGLFLLRPNLVTPLFEDDFESGDLGRWSLVESPALAPPEPEAAVDSAAGQ